MADSTQSSIVVAAPPEEVLDVIADFESYPEWTGAVRAVEILVADEDGWAEQVRYTLDAGAIRDTYTLAYTWDLYEDGTGTVSWHLVDGQVLKAMDGAYELVAVDGGTQVTYTLAVEVKMPMIGMLRRRAEKTIIDTALNELRKRVEGR
jgi:ribosome-associated toxin RatA of RatAB toxin-antitoxin module